MSNEDCCTCKRRPTFRVREAGKEIILTLYVEA